MSWTYSLQRVTDPATKDVFQSLQQFLANPTFTSIALPTTGTAEPQPGRPAAPPVGLMDRTWTAGMVDDGIATSQVTGLTLTAGNGGFQATWNAVPDADFQSLLGVYELQWDTSGSFPGPLARTTITTGRVQGGLTNGTLYHVRVRAVDPWGNAGAWSATATVTPSAAAVTLFTDPFITNQIVADAITSDKIAAQTIVTGKFIQSGSYVAGVSGWQILGNGNAEFNNVTVRGTVASSTIDGSTINLGTAGNYRIVANSTGLNFYDSANVKFGDIVSTFLSANRYIQFTSELSNKRSRIVLASGGGVFLESWSSVSGVTYSSLSLDADTGAGRMTWSGQQFVVNAAGYMGRWPSNGAYMQFGYLGSTTNYGMLVGSGGETFLSGSTLYLRVANDDRVTVGANVVISRPTAGQVLQVNSGTGTRYSSEGDWSYAQLRIEGGSGASNPVAGLTMNVNGYAPQIYAFNNNGNTLSLRDAANSGYTAMYGSSFTNPSSVLIKKELVPLDKRYLRGKTKNLRKVTWLPEGPLLHSDGTEHVCGVHCAGGEEPCAPYRQHNHRRFGLIAEEVEALWPEATRRDQMTGILGIDYAALVPVLFAIVEDLEDRLDALNG
jgi:hypothetical protein